MVVGTNLEPVVDSAQNDVRGQQRGQSAVLELDVDHREVVDVVIVAADVAFVAEVGRSRHGMRPGGNTLRANRLTVAHSAFDPF